MLFGLVPLSAPSTRPDIFPHERFTVGWCGAYRVIKNRQGYGHRASFLHFSERCVCKTFKIIWEGRREREKEKWWRIEGREDGQNRTRQEDGKKIILHFVPPYCFLYCKRNWTDYSGCSWGFWRELSISSLTSSCSLVFTFSCASTSWSCVLCTARLMINIVFTGTGVRPTPVCRLADTFTKLWLDNRQTGRCSWPFLPVCSRCDDQVVEDDDVVHTAAVALKGLNDLACVHVKHPHSAVCTPRDDTATLWQQWPVSVEWHVTSDM